MKQAPIHKLLERVEWERLPSPGEPPKPGELYATHSGVVTFGERDLRCYQLNDGQRVFDAADIHAMFEASPDTLEEEK